MENKKPSPTYRYNEMTEEWEQVPEREPMIADWGALWIFAIATGTAIGGSILFRLILWN